MFTVKLHSNMHSLVPVGYSQLASTLVCAHTNKHAPAQTLKLMLVDTKKTVWVIDTVNLNLKRLKNVFFFFS